MSKYLVHGDLWVRVRSAPATDAAIIGGVASGATVDVLAVAGQWARVSLDAGGVRLGTEGAITSPAFGYMFAPLLSSLEVPVPTLPPSRARLGFAVIFNRDAAFAAGNAGCRYFSIIGNPELASQVKDRWPDAVVMVQPYLNVSGSLPSIDYTMKQLNGATDPRLIYTGINESDQVGQDVRGIKTRAPYDVAMATAVAKSSVARYAAGSWSVGCPDYTSKDVCDCLKALYAPHYNSGLFDLDHHLYSPNMRHVHETGFTPVNYASNTDNLTPQQWFETRWIFNFQRCGFDPSCPSRIFCSETGVDEGSVGGFPAHYATPEQVLSWAKRFIEVSSAPITVSGKTYNSPLVGAAIFQLGDTDRWLGYNVQSFVTPLGPIY
jgi:Bacterial SH3 domain